MLDAVVDPQPVISRLTRSKDHLLSSSSENLSLSSKISILGHARTLGFFSPHRRTHFEVESTAPSFQDYLLLSGGGLEPGLKVSPDAKSVRTRRSSSSCEASDSILKELILSSPSTGGFSSESFDQDLKNHSCAAAPLLKASSTPTVASRNEYNSISSIISVLVSALIATKSSREHHIERLAKQAPSSDEPRQLRNMSILRSQSSMQFSEMPIGVGGQVNDGPNSAANMFEMKFASPSFIRPQGRKLVARREPSPLIYSNSMTNLQYNHSANSLTMDVPDEGIALSRIPVKQDVILEEDETSNFDTDRHNQMPLSKHIPEQYQIPEYDHVPRHKSYQKQLQAWMQEQDKRKPAGDLFGQRMAEQIDSIVEAAALDDSAKPEWRTYMENYSKGSFNISTPPAPPPLSSTLMYLPSIFPCTEAQRVFVFNSHRLSWNKVTADRLSHLLAAVMVKFGLDCGAISFFNKKNEYIKAERGYNVENISRSTSIAAHGLLSADVFVIPDTEKDWRFQSHPLVIGGPKIRFFAGAPLLGERGQPIGMLSIFSETCQPDFSPFDRRELADFAAEAMKDLTLESQSELSPSGPSTPKLERSLVVDSSHLSKRSDPIELENNDVHDLAPVPLSLHYRASKTQSTGIVNKPTSHNNSSPGNQGFLSRPNQGYNQPSDFGLDDGSSLYKLDDLHIREFVPPSPRPFSSSDVSSIHKHPTNTPVHSQLAFPTTPGLDFSAELLRSLSGAEYAASTPEDDDQYLMSNNKFTGLSPRKTTLRTPEPNTPLSSNGSILRGVHTSVWPSENNTLASYRPASREDARAKAALICSRTSKRLGYDLVYAVELNPSLDAIDETKVLEPGVLPMRILAAYGMNEPFRPNPQVHIEALRSKGFYSWQAPRNTDEAPGGYRSGCLIAIPTQGGVQHLRTSGIVIGAFRKPQPGRRNAVETTNAELQSLVNAGNEVKSLFWLPTDSPLKPSLLQSRAAPMSAPYPAHEAVRIGQYTTNSQTHNPAYVNCPGIHSGNTYTPGSSTQDLASNGSKPATKEPARFQFIPRLARY